MFQGGYNSMSPAIVNRSQASQASQPSSSSWFSNNLPAIGVMRYDGSKISYKLNNNDFVNTSDSDAVNNIAQSTLYIGSRAGSSLFSSGYFGEIIIYDRAISDDDVDNIVQYLNKKWGI